MPAVCDMVDRTARSLCAGWPVKPVRGGAVKYCPCLADLVQICREDSRSSF